METFMIPDSREVANTTFMIPDRQHTGYRRRTFTASYISVAAVEERRFVPRSFASARRTSRTFGSLPSSPAPRSVSASTNAPSSARGLWVSAGTSSPRFVGTVCLPRRVSPLAPTPSGLCPDLPPRLRSSGALRSEEGEAPRKDHPCAGRPTASPPGPHHAFARTSFGWPRRYCRLRTESSSAALLFAHYTPFASSPGVPPKRRPLPPGLLYLARGEEEPPQECRLNRGHGLTKAEPDPR